MFVCRYTFILYIIHTFFLWPDIPFFSLRRPSNCLPTQTPQITIYRRRVQTCTHYKRLLLFYYICLYIYCRVSFYIHKHSTHNIELYIIIIDALNWTWSLEKRIVVQDISIHVNKILLSNIQYIILLLVLFP